MNIQRLFGLLLLALTACGPISGVAVATPTVSVLVAPLVTESSPVSVEPVSAVATSRGADLFASDPAQVRLDAGLPVLVEFFRFT
jgi:hypothetical protein